MGHRHCFEFGEQHLSPERITGRDVLEIGAHADGGSMRPFVSKFSPRSYTGIDIQEGPGVDVVCDAMSVLDRFGPESFDVLISNELLEHIRDWRRIIHIFKAALRPGGVMIITTRSIGFPFHHAPFDFWRYEPEDMAKIFADCEIVAMERDPHVLDDGRPTPGIFVAVCKPASFCEVDLSSLELFSILTGRRMLQISNASILAFEFRKLGARYLLRHHGMPFLLRDAVSRRIVRPLKALARPSMPAHDGPHGA